MRRSAFGVVGAFALLLLGAAPAPAQSEDAARELADKFSPITMIREQTDPPCQTTAEQYEPTSVDTVLGNPAVELYKGDPDGPVEAVDRGADAAQIAGLGKNYYLDLNGDPLGDTCVYAKDFAKLVADGAATPLTYARIAREKGHDGFALQYWFFWYFNQFNDLHEGDWEGMQITFDDPTPEAALRNASEPGEIIVFQHAGGERADWSDSKVQKEGDHPIVYPAAGSHATFYDSTVYVQNGQRGSGVGCDNTSDPLRRLDPAVDLLPDESTDRGPFKWLSYLGRWGQREEGFNNGPTGPATKTVWSQPFTWMAEQRTTSPRLPGGSIVGPQVTGAFCGAVAFASELINLNQESTPALIVTILVLLTVIGLFVGFTRWRPVQIEDLRAERAFGQLVRAARRLYSRYWRVLVPVSALAILIVGGTNLLANLLGSGSGVSDATGQSGIDLGIADLVDALGRPVASALVAAIVIVVVRLVVQARDPEFRAALAGVRERVWRVIFAQLLATLGVIALALTIIGLPVAIWKLVGWAFVQQEVLFTDKSIRDSFRGSSALVRGRWFHAVRAIIFFALLGAVTGPIFTFALIFTALPLVWIDVIGAILFALLIPYTTLGKTLLYFDLQARAETEGIKPRRSLKPWRPRQFGRRVEPQSPGTGPAEPTPA